MPAFFTTHVCRQVAEGALQMARHQMLNGMIYDAVLQLLAFEPVAFPRYFLQQPFVDSAFTRFTRHRGPKMADFPLPDAMNATEALLQPVWVPVKFKKDITVSEIINNVDAEGCWPTEMRLLIMLDTAVQKMSENSAT